MKAIHVKVLQWALLLAFPCLNSVHAAEGVLGTWEGQLRMGKRSMRLVFDLKALDGGGVSGTAGFPDQGVRDLKVDGVLYNHPELFIEFDQFGGVYRGSYNSETDQIDGKWLFHAMRGPMADIEMALRRSARKQIEPDSLDYDHQVAGPVLKGYWKAPVKLPPNVELEFVLKLGLDGEDVLHGFLDIPQQGGNNIPIQEIQVESERVTMNFPGLQLKFEGQIDADGNRLTGEFKGFPQKLEVTFDRIAEPPGSVTQQLSFESTGSGDAKGYWQGTLKVQGTQLRLAVAIGVNDQGEHQATMDSLDQRSYDIPASGVVVEDGTFEVKWSAIGATYSGSVADDGRLLDGTFKQGPLSVPLEMKRQDGPAKR